MATSRRDRTERARPKLLRLLKERSFRRGTVRLASGQTSDFFIDCKPTVLSAEGHHLVGELMLDALRQLPKCEAVAGVALGGCPLASAVSLTSVIRNRPLPAVYVRKETKGHGTQKRVEGTVHAGMTVAILEDVITTGGSTLRAVEVLREAGCEVVGVVTLVDRLEGGLENLTQAGLVTVALYTRHDFVEGELDNPLSETLGVESQK